MKYIFTFLKFSLVGIIFLYLYSSNLITPDLVLHLYDLPKLFLQIIALLLLIIFLGNLKWLILMRTQAINLTLGRCFTIYYLGYTFNYFLPGGIAGDIFKAGYIMKKGSSRSIPALSILLDRVMGLYSMLIVLLIFLPYLGNYFIDYDFKIINEYYITYVIAVAIIFFGILFIFFNTLKNEKFYLKIKSFLSAKSEKNKIYKLLLSISNALFLYKNSIKEVIFNIILAAIIQFLIGYCLLIISGYILGQSTEFLTHTISSILAQVLSIIPISPGGIGVGEISYAKTMHFLNNDLLSYATVFLIYRIYNLFFGIPAIFIFLFNKSLKTKN